MKRGFKSLCENLSLNYRKNLGLSKKSPLSPYTLAEYLDVILIDPKNIPDLQKKHLDTLLKEKKSSWSAVTLLFNNTNAIIYNSSHAKSRQTNDMMHELSHIILEHKPTGMHSYEMGLFLRYYDKTQEEESDCLAATLLLPRDILINIKYSHMDISSATRKYSVSPALINMRLNTSGVNIIYKRTRDKIT